MVVESDTKIAERILQGIHLPPCPAVLMAVMKEVRSPNADPGRIANLIREDAGLSAPMLKLANSPYFGLRNKVSTVQQAVTVLGLKNAVNLLTNVALRANVVPNLPGMDKFWDRSGMVAMAASIIARDVPGLSSEDAYTIGLFHDCGIPVLMQKYPDYPKNVEGLLVNGGNRCIAENACYSTTHAVVGNLLARSWLLPANMCKAILWHHDTSIYASISDLDSIEVCNWVSIIRAADSLVDTHLNLRNDSWLKWEPFVLKHLQISRQEFDEMRSDVITALRGGE